MRTLIIGDIHGCARELEELIYLSRPGKIVAVGDLFDRAHEGVEVWRLIHKFGIQCCRGNHEKKMLAFLKGERSWVPWHYQYFLDNFAAAGLKISSLIRFLENLPLLIKIDSDALVAHGGVCLDDPWREDESMNIYGRFNPNEKMPAHVDRPTDWWNEYTKNVKVYYGHISHSDILDKGNSVCLDTAACHGGKLSGMIHETGEIFQVQSQNYFQEVSELKPKLAPYEKVRANFKEARQKMTQGPVTQKAIDLIKSSRKY